MGVTRVNGQDVRDQGINTVDIKDDAVTTAKILNANVTNVKLDTTGVLAGTYSISSFVVNAQGRITSATEIMTTKGDLISFSTIPTRLGVGANGTVLVADSSQSLGIKWLLQSAVAPLSYTSSTGTFSLAGLTSLGSANQIVGVNAAATAWEYKTISGTVNRLSVSQGVGTITLNIDTAYIGQTSITTLGTVTTGTWNGSIVSEIYGGTNQSSYTLGDTLYASAANTLSKLAGNITTTKKFLRQTGNGTVSAAPAWDTLVAGDIPALAYVTSVALSAPVEFTVSGSPVTSSGTLTFTKAAQAANTIWCGPVSGGSAAPTFRLLVASDLPSSFPQFGILALFSDSTNSVSNKFLSTENVATSDTLPAVAPVTGTISKITFSGSNNSPTGNIEIRKNTTVGAPALTIALAGTKTQVSVVSLAVTIGDQINCKVAAGASNVGKPLVKLFY